MKYDTRVSGNLEIIDNHHQFEISIILITNTWNLNLLSKKRKKKICLPKYDIEFLYINKIFKLEFHYHNFKNENILT